MSEAQVTSRLIHGDCLEVMPTLAAQGLKANLVFADLPYGVTKCAWDSIIPISELWPNILPCCAPKAAMVFTATQPFASVLVSSAPHLFRYDLQWLKSTATGFFNAKKMPMRAHESLLIFYKNLPTYNPQKTIAKRRQGTNVRRVQTRSHCYGELEGKRTPWCEDGTRYPLSYLYIASENRQNSLHSTQKPVALLEWLIKTYTDIGDTVLDPCAGSMTTAVACLRTGRHCIAIERDANYFAIGQKRVADERAKLGMGAM